MKAWVLESNGEIVFKDVDKPEYSSDEVLVKVKAAGICGSDIPRIYRGGAYFYPLIPGHEFSGEIADSANKNDIGKRVGVFPLIPCGQCGPCRNSLFEMCKKYSYIGSRRNGAFAEYVAVPENNIIELPDSVSFQCAAMMEPMAVAVHSIRKISPDKNDSIVICGLGTIGMFILMFLIEMGYENLFVIGNKDFQKETVLKLGINEERFCDTRKQNVNEWIMGKTTYGSDTYFECIGKNENISNAIECAAPGGKVMLVGNPASDISFEKNIYWKILRNQLTVKGTWNSSFTHSTDDDWHYVIDRISQGRVDPSIFITHIFELDKLEKGFTIMRDKSEEYIKIMFADNN